MSEEKVRLDEVLDALAETAEEVLDIRELLMEGALEWNGTHWVPGRVGFGKEEEEKFRRWFSILRRAGRGVERAERLGFFAECPGDERN